MEDYKHVSLRDVIRIDRVVNASRLEIGKHYAFEGERHDFWEFQYAALGSSYIYTKNNFYELKQGQITFFRPGKFHVLYGNGRHGAELWVFSFRCASPLMEKYDELLITAPEECRQLMERIVDEAARGFDVTSHPEDGRILRRKATASFGCEQLIKNRLEELMLLLFRSESGGRRPRGQDEVTPHQEPSGPAEEMRAYLQAHTHSTLSLGQLAEVFHISVTYAKKLYRAECGVRGQPHGGLSPHEDTGGEEGAGQHRPAHPGGGKPVRFQEHLLLLEFFQKAHRHDPHRIPPRAKRPGRK